MHNKSTSSVRLASCLSGTCLAVAIAIAFAIFASPVTADDKLGNGMKCESGSECKSGSWHHNVCEGR
jgi:hypothetical protein